MRAPFLGKARQDARTLRVLHAAVTDQLKAAWYELARWVPHETPLRPCDGDFCPVQTPRHLYPQCAGREVNKQSIAATSQAADARPSCHHSASCTASITGVRFETYSRLLVLG